MNKTKEQKLKEIAVEFGYSGLFHTPKNMKEVQEWVELHSPEEKAHLYTVMFMTINFYSGLIAEIKTGYEK
jgi:hypothetical protein